MTIDRQWCYVITFIEHCLGSFHIVEVGVDHGCNRASCTGSQLLERKRHLLHRFASVKRDDALWRIDEGLVGQSVSNQTPCPWANFIEVSPQHSALGEMVFVNSSAIWRHHGALIVRLEATRGHFVSRRTPSSWHTTQQKTPNQWRRRRESKTNGTTTLTSLTNQTLV